MEFTSKRYDFRNKDADYASLADELNGLLAGEQDLVANAANTAALLFDALPDIIDGLIARAREGDTKAAVYLCDRILGRVAGSAMPPADDRREPYTEDAFRLDQHPIPHRPAGDVERPDVRLP